MYVWKENNTRALVSLFFVYNSSMYVCIIVPLFVLAVIVVVVFFTEEKK